ncbi:T6SS phospholipase effector Tle1-like catalytic domain-containing protein [Heliomarina baculiformis]|uniref:T6SS phospholipase effector Tle1-like catalytic domain-containing protein n=1 Tax=Heliomarina baculiformis TaxID=2872036 RepID=UPI001EE39B58|nr:DUF2235 domain-containing protein [Heliomarina baculiformis]
MSRRIVICFDGTGNEVGDRESNMLKLYKGLTQGEDQITHYVPGVGTMDGPRLFGSKLINKTRSLLGLAFGMGLEDDVLDAYRFLCRTYQGRDAKQAAHRARRERLEQDARDLGVTVPDIAEGDIDPDRIYIFGFSRGAYAARILAGFVHNFGLVAPDKLHLITGAYRAYRLVTDMDRGQPDEVVFKKLRQFHDVLSPDPDVPIRALGLFDTVASMARFSRPLRNLARWRSPMELATHANVMRNRSVRIVLHAQAVDERRSMFRALPWVPSSYYGNRFKQPAAKRWQYVQQRWFPGFHGDIGGTNREYYSGIGKISLLWMLDQLAEFEAQADAEDGRAPLSGLSFHKGYRDDFLRGGDTKARTRAGDIYAKPDAMAPIHSSMGPGWWPLEILPKTTKRREWPSKRGFGWYIPWSEPRAIPGDHHIDDSVYERMQRWRFYRPVNVPEKDDMNIRPPSNYLTANR